MSMQTNSVKEIKKKIREKIWRIMEEKNIAKFPRPVYGRIPNFIGAEKAASKLFSTDLWRSARVVKVNPDSPQQPVRYRALFEGKILIMPTPRLRNGFILLNPRKMPYSAYRYASTIRGAFIYGKIIDEKRLPLVDLIVIGSVAVSKDGSRLGKGGGYAELEYGILRELGLVDEDTPIATTVHDVQVLGENAIPREKHDLPVDYIVTPTRIIKTTKPKPKPSGIYWNILPREKIMEIPILKKMKKRKRL